MGSFCEVLSDEWLVASREKEWRHRYFWLSSALMTRHSSLTTHHSLLVTHHSPLFTGPRTVALVRSAWEATITDGDLATSRRASSTWSRGTIDRSSTTSRLRPLSR